jgi:hypothetical protein
MEHYLDNIFGSLKLAYTNLNILAHTTIQIYLDYYFVGNRKNMQRIILFLVQYSCILIPTLNIIINL